MVRAGIRALAALCLGIVLAAPVVHAEDPPVTVSAGTKIVTLSWPEKTCPYSRGDKNDAKIIDALEKADPRSKLLIAFIDCDNLNAVRGAKNSVFQPSYYYGQVISGISGQTTADKYEREDYVAAISKQFGTESADAVMARGETILAGLISGKADDGKPQVLGVIKRDKDFIQLAMFGSQTLPNGTIQKVVNIVTYTKAGVPVVIYLAHPATSDITLQALSEHAELYSRQLIALNPDSNFFLHALDFMSLMVGFVIGIIGSTVLRWMLSRH